MEHEYKYLLYLLENFLSNQGSEETPEIDWQKLIQLAHIHNVLGVLGYMTMKHPICQDENLRKSLHQICLNTISV